jgi:NAD(P)-dependent dehydrogenase (short-subunit alcohol dehydrogenase family)
MKTAIITGASGHLGTAVVKSFFQASTTPWNLLLPMQTEDEISDFAERHSNYSQNYQASICDLTQQDAVAQFAEKFPTQIDAVVCLAGGIEAGKATHETSYDVFLKMFALNFRTAALTIQQALPKMQEHGGSIVTIGAKPVDTPQKNMAAYASSKAALITLTQTIAEEGKESGVRANCIAPSIIDTPANREWGSEDDIQRWVKPEEIATMILHLCSDIGKAITGAVVPMYGGV